MTTMGVRPWLSGCANASAAWSSGTRIWTSWPVPTFSPSRSPVGLPLWIDEESAMWCHLLRRWHVVERPGIARTGGPRPRPASSRGTGPPALHDRTYSSWQDAGRPRGIVETSVDVPEQVPRHHQQRSRQDDEEQVELAGDDECRH